MLTFSSRIKKYFHRDKKQRSESLNIISADIKIIIAMIIILLAMIIIIIAMIISEMAMIISLYKRRPTSACSPVLHLLILKILRYWNQLPQPWDLYFQLSHLTSDHSPIFLQNKKRNIILPYSYPTPYIYREFRSLHFASPESLPQIRSDIFVKIRHFRTLQSYSGYFPPNNATLR